MDYAAWKRWNAKVARGNPGDCWLWTGSLTRDGYGLFRDYGPVQMAHRVGYEYYVGPIPEGLTIDHLCRVKGCVNPDHLESVTLKENIRRGDGWSGKNARKTHCLHGHPFDEANTITNAKGHRTCRACTHVRYASRRQAARGS